MRAVIAGVFLAGFVGAVVLTQPASTAAAMAAAADRWIETLGPAEKAQATFPFDSDERRHWGFVPREMFPRHGLLIQDMSEVQRASAHALLRTGLSEGGYATATAIMQLDLVLRELEGRSGRGRQQIERNPELYYFSLFGTPSPRGAWGWRVEGHHVSLNFTVVNGRFVATAPAFFGANPAEVREGPERGLRVLGPREDAARRLLDALDPSQRTRATLEGAAPGDILTMNATPAVDPLSPVGLAASAMTPAQRDLLLQLVRTYTDAMAPELAADRLERLRTAGLDRMTFAWAGPAERGQKHYYRVQGPTFLVEYDNTQNNANHIHSVWRDFDGDFGRDLLREHLASSAH